jgi:hypothetical protein
VIAACGCGCAMQSQLSYDERVSFAMWKTEIEDGSQRHIAARLLVVMFLVEVAIVLRVLT